VDLSLEVVHEHFRQATDTSTVRPADSVITATFFPSRHPIDDYNGHGPTSRSGEQQGVRIRQMTSKTTLIGVKGPGLE
jgi:hypothetical protein